MIALPITALFTSLLVFWFVFLSLKASFARGVHQVSLGDGEHGSDLNKVVRAHGNAAEYTALFLVVVALLEYHGLRSELLYVIGIAFVLGRLLHRRALLQGSITHRIWAMQLTAWPLVIGAAILFYTWLAQVVIF